MPITMFHDGRWIVQVQRNGMRRTGRGRGGIEAARAAEARLLATLVSNEGPAATPTPKAPSQTARPLAATQAPSAPRRRTPRPTPLRVLRAVPPTPPDATAAPARPDTTPPPTDTLEASRTVASLFPPRSGRPVAIGPTAAMLAPEPQAGPEQSPLRSRSACETSPPLRDFFRDRFVPYALRHHAASTREATRSRYAYLLYYLGDTPLSQCAEPLAQHRFVEALLAGGPLTFAAGRDGRPLPPRCRALTHATANSCLAALRTVLSLAYDEHYLDRPPRVKTFPRADDEPVVPPTEAEFARLLGACEALRAKAPLLPEVVEFVAETGLRAGEVFHLRWPSVDLATNMFRIERARKPVRMGGTVWRPKNRKWRVVVLTEPARAILVRLRELAVRESAVRESAAGLEDALVFENENGAPYHTLSHAPDGVAVRHGYFKDAVEAAGLRGKVTFHSLRHLFAVRLLTRGVPVETVSKLMGHSSIAITVDRYGQYAADAAYPKEAIRRYDEVRRAEAARTPKAGVGDERGEDPRAEET